MSPGPELGGRRFWKMTGSGNDFVFFDNRTGEHDDLAAPGPIEALCDRRKGVGADGIVLIDSSDLYAFGMRYYNRDGSLAEMCGNAALCSARLAVTLGIGSRGQDLVFDTTSGPVTGRVVDDEPEIDMVDVAELTPTFAARPEGAEQRLGYARVGVPHVVVLTPDVDAIEVVQRGRRLRFDPHLPAGANVNFVSPEPGGERWRMRTYERGVEDETLACGSGTIAAAALLQSWGLSGDRATLHTKSGCDIRATVGGSGRPPVLRGEGRLVYEGVVGSIAV